MPPRTNKIDQHNKKPPKDKAQGEAGPPEQHSLTNPEPPAVSVSESEMALYKDLPPERQSRAKNYISTLKTIEHEAEDIEKIRTYMNNPVNMPIGVRIELQMREEDEEEDIGKVKRDYKEAVSVAAKEAEQRINRIRAEAKVDKESLKKQIAEDEKDRVYKIEAKVGGIVANAKNARKRKQELEQEGGFQLGLDVGMIEEKRKRKREAES
jgi:hypothetical protein